MQPIAPLMHLPGILPVTAPLYSGGNKIGGLEPSQVVAKIMTDYLNS